MSNKSKRLTITYSDSINEVKLINNGEINMEEDYVFEGTNIRTLINNQTFDIKKALDELYKNIQNLEYLNN